MLELDLELVAFDRCDRAVAELAVEDAHAQREVVAAFVAEADGAGAGFGGGSSVSIVISPHPPTAIAAGPSLSLKGRGARCSHRALKSRAARTAAHGLRWAQVREGVGVFAPLGAP